jgi:hypothetical protein
VAEYPDHIGSLACSIGEIVIIRFGFGISETFCHSNGCSRRSPGQFRRRMLLKWNLSADSSMVFSFPGAEFATLATMIALTRFLPGPMRLSPALIRAGAWLGAALVVGWVLASWFWQLAVPGGTPGVEPAPVPDHESAAKAVVSRHLFGRASSGGDDQGAGHGEVNLKLLGAMTASREAAGFAILAEEGKPSLAAVEGETFLPGVTLLQVLPGQVRLKVGDRVETIEMTKTSSLPPRP